MSIRQIHIYTIGLLACLFLLVGCTQEEDIHVAKGKLRLAIGQVHTQTESRATPAELGAPLAEHFKLKVQRQGSDYFTYEDDFVPEMEVLVGTYDITATHGEDVIIGRDTPYYIGTTTCEVVEDGTPTVTIPCKVGNALVSVKFGRNETERARFDRYYTSFGLLVQVGRYSLEINPDNIESSIYFPAGSSPEFIFYGTLADDNGRLVSTTLTHSSLPKVFQAADHATLTLTLPDPESALGVNIGKVEMETVNLDETIPLSWLPVPQVKGEHQYNNGMLMGTDLVFPTSYPGMTWEARVSNEQGDIIRTVRGEGALTSGYADSAEWPFLPAGKYKATYFLHAKSGEKKVGSREFMVTAPQLEAKVSGYTSYDKYLAGDIEAANKADGLTLFEPQVSANISTALAANARYGYQMTYTFNGTTGTATGNTQNLGNQKLDASLTAYNLSAKVTFAGQEATTGKDFLITGIPFKFEPPSTSTWESSNYVEDHDGFVRLGHNAWNVSGEQTLTYSKVAIPTGTRLIADYKFVCNSGLITTSFTLYAGEQTVAYGDIGTYKNTTFEEAKPITIEAPTTYIRCYNEEGRAQAYSDVYRVAFRYNE